MTFERKEIVRKPAEVSLETDLEAIERFTKEVYVGIDDLTRSIDCDKLSKCDNSGIKGTRNTCKSCKLYVYHQCELILIKTTAHNIMWKIKDGQWRDHNE